MSRQGRQIWVFLFTIVILVVSLVGLTSCLAPAPTSTPAPTSPPAPSPTPTPAPMPTPAPTPPSPASIPPSPQPPPAFPQPSEPSTPSPPPHIPKGVLASHFGFVGADVSYDEMTRLGIKWDRPHPGPFTWNGIERQKGTYSWYEPDRLVQQNQSFNLATLATIWPFAEWDQANWGPAGTSSLAFENKGLCRGRRKPYDMQAYKRFVSALVERYDGDAIDDMPGLKYPIKYWEASNEPSMQSGHWTFFSGSSEDYLEVLKATYQAVKEADPEAKVLHAGMAGMEPFIVSFWKPVFRKGSQYFDIANIHCFSKPDVAASAEPTVPEFKKLLSKCGVTKPIWVTEAQYSVGEATMGRIVSREEHGQIFAKMYIMSFACGVDKVFYTSFKPHPSAPPRLKQAALIDQSGERGLAYYALKTLISKLDKFTSVEKLAEGRYRFMVEGKAIYVLWGSGKIPEEITGEVLVTDIHGEETRTNSSAINLTESPIFVEEHPH